MDEYEIKNYNSLYFEGFFGDDLFVFYYVFFF